MCVTVEEYCRSHGFNDSDINSDDNGNCVSDSGPPMPVQMVVNEYSISPAEDYFNGFVLGVNKESYLSKGYSILLIRSGTGVTLPLWIWPILLISIYLLPRQDFQTTQSKSI